jgi:hypothetical protein
MRSITDYQGVESAQKEPYRSGCVESAQEGSYFCFFIFFIFSFWHGHGDHEGVYAVGGNEPRRQAILDVFRFPIFWGLGFHWHLGLRS